MKKHTKMSLLLVVLMIASLFTGCSQEDKELVDAFIKSQEILSLESTSEMVFNLSAEGLNEESQVMFDAIASQINNMNLSLKQKSVANKDQTVAKAQVDANIQLNGMSFDSSIWVDMDMSGDDANIKEIFKLPSMLMSLIPGAVDKEYIVLDFERLNQAMTGIEQDVPGQIDLDKTMAIAMKYQKKFTAAFLDYMKGYNFNGLAVTKLDDQMVNDEKIKYYQVAFDNDSFKEFLKYTTISMLEDENIVPLFQEYMTELMGAAGEKLPEELSIIGKSTEMVQMVKTFFETIEDLTILGEDGILITFGINEDGYFVSEAGKMDFVIDTKQVMNLMPASMKGNQALEAMPTPVFELSISYDSKMYNINQDVKITMPTTTEENSIDYMDLIKTMIPENPQGVFEVGEHTDELMVILEDKLVEFTNQPILVNNHYLVSTKDMAKEFNAAISWNEETKEIVIEKGENHLKFNAKTKQLVVNGKSQNITTDIVIREGVSYIPLRAIAENLGYTLTWDQELKMMVVYK